MLSRSLITLCVFLLAGVVHAQVVATVNGAKITLKDFKRKYNETKKTTINPPPPELFLEDLVRLEMGVQEAEKRGLEKDPTVKEAFRRELYKALIEKELGKKVDAIKVSESEMRAHYKKYPEIRSSHILIEFPPDATSKQKAAARKRADEIFKEVRASKRPFKELVKLYSDDHLSKMNGGDIGFQSNVTVVPTYYNTLMKLKPGQIAGPVETLYGYHIVKMTGRNSYQDADKRQIRVAVFDKKRAVLFNAYFKRLRSKYKITKDENLIKSVK